MNAPVPQFVPTYIYTPESEKQKKKEKESESESESERERERERGLRERGLRERDINGCTPYLAGAVVKGVAVNGATLPVLGLHEAGAFGGAAVLDRPAG